MNEIRFLSYILIWEYKYSQISMSYSTTLALNITRLILEQQYKLLTNLLFLTNFLKSVNKLKGSYK